MLYTLPRRPAHAADCASDSVPSTTSRCSGARAGNLPAFGPPSLRLGETLGARLLCPQGGPPTGTFGFIESGFHSSILLPGLPPDLFAAAGMCRATALAWLGRSTGGVAVAARWRVVVSGGPARGCRSSHGTAVAGLVADRSEAFGFWLRSRFPELGRAAEFAEFWRSCFGVMPLSQAMAWLDRDGVAVP